MVTEPTSAALKRMTKSWGPYAWSLAPHLMPQIVDGKHRACAVIYAPRPVFGSQVHWHHGGVPVVGNEDAVIAICAAIDLQLQWRFQARQTQKCVAILHGAAWGSQ